VAGTFFGDYDQEIDYGVPYDNGKGGAVSTTGHCSHTAYWDSSGMPPTPDRPQSVPAWWTIFLYANMIHQAEFPIQPVLHFTQLTYNDQHGEIVITGTGQSQLA